MYNWDVRWPCSTIIDELGFFFFTLKEDVGGYFKFTESYSLAAATCQLYPENCRFSRLHNLIFGVKPVDCPWYSAKICISMTWIELHLTINIYEARMSCWPREACRTKS